MGASVDDRAEESQTYQILDDITGRFELKSSWGTLLFEWDSEHKILIIHDNTIQIVKKDSSA